MSVVIRGPRTWILWSVDPSPICTSLNNQIARSRSTFWTPLAPRRGAPSSSIQPTLKVPTCPLHLAVYTSRPLEAPGDLSVTRRLGGWTEVTETVNAPSSTTPPAPGRRRCIGGRNIPSFAALSPSPSGLASSTSTSPSSWRRCSSSPPASPPRPYLSLAPFFFFPPLLRLPVFPL